VFLESLKITNFRCFGSAPQTIKFEEDITARQGAKCAMAVAGPPPFSAEMLSPRSKFESECKELDFLQFRKS
jgi:hypothetical protein